MSARWHVVTSDSPTVYAWDDFRDETAEQRAKDFARTLGYIADAHPEGTDYEAWGCMERLADAAGTGDVAR